MSEFEIEEGVHAAPPRAIVYGPPGIGKTTLVASSDKPIFADLERGSLLLNVSRNKKPIDTWEKLMAMSEFVATGKHDRQTYVIDTLDRAEQLLHDYICRTNRDGKGRLAPCNRMEEVAGGFGKGYDAAVEEARRLCAILERIWERGIAYILIAHAKLEPVQNPSGSDYNRYNLAIHKKLCGMFYAMSDMVLFANAPVFVKKEGQFDGKRERATGGDTRYLYTRGAASWMAKNRYGLPARMNMSWDDVMKGVAVGNSPDALREAIAEKLLILGNPEIEKKVAVKVIEAKDDVALLITICGKLDVNIAKMEETAAQEAENAAAALVAQPQTAQPSA